MLINTTAAIQILNNNLVSANGAAGTAVPDPFETNGFVAIYPNVMMHLQLAPDL